MELYLDIFLKVLVALSASLSAVSTGGAFGFTSQITYSFQHGNDQLMKMAIGEYVWIGMKEKCHCRTSRLLKIAKMPLSTSVIN